MSGKISIVKISNIEDKRGKISFFEFNKDINFSIKRVYYIHDVRENMKRGFHAHKNLKQLLVAINGSFDIDLFIGKDKSTYKLDNCNEGIILEGIVWRELYNFSSDAICMCFASNEYDEDDYIKNFDEFLEWSNNEV